MHARVIGPESNEVLVISTAKDWIADDAVVVCESGFVDLEEMR
jgi:hypothetical protein